MDFDQSGCCGGGGVHGDYCHLCQKVEPTGGNFFFAVVKFFEYKIAISANFVQTVKNSNEHR